MNAGETNELLVLTQSFVNGVKSLLDHQPPNVSFEDAILKEK